MKEMEEQRRYRGQNAGEEDGNGGEIEERMMVKEKKGQRRKRDDISER